jgi:hypothetical protein
MVLRLSSKSRPYSRSWVGRQPGASKRLMHRSNIALLDHLVAAGKQRGLARQLCAAIVHLGAALDLLPPARVAELKRALPASLIMRSIPVYGEDSIAIACSYEAIADSLLLDSYRPTDPQIGAVGATHDWSISRRIVATARVPVILAGGLGPDNVAQAIRVAAPAGVDSKTRPIARERIAKTWIGCAAFTRRLSQPVERKASSWRPSTDNIFCSWPRHQVGKPQKPLQMRPASRLRAADNGPAGRCARSCGHGFEPSSLSLRSLREEAGAPEPWVAGGHARATRVR